MIIAGVALIERFEWLMAVFGGFLIYTGIKLLFADEDNDPSKSKLVQFLQKKLPLSEKYYDEKFVVWETPKPELIDVGPDAKPAEATGPQRRVFTRLFLVLLVIEFSDVIFAVDSIPAIFGISRDPFIVFTSNVCAVMGLRAMFFLLEDVIDRFHYLKYCNLCDGTVLSRSKALASQSQDATSMGDTGKLQPGPRSGAYTDVKGEIHSYE